MQLQLPAPEPCSEPWQSPPFLHGQEMPYNCSAYPCNQSNIQGCLNHLHHVPALFQVQLQVAYQPPAARGRLGCPTCVSDAAGIICKRAKQLQALDIGHQFLPQQTCICNSEISTIGHFAGYAMQKGVQQALDVNQCRRCIRESLLGSHQEKPALPAFPVHACHAASGQMQYHEDEPH